MKINNIPKKYFSVCSVYFYVCSLFNEAIEVTEKTIIYDDKELSGLKLHHKDKEVFVAEFRFDWLVIFEPSKKNKQEEIYNQDDFLNFCLDIHKFLNRK